MSSGKTRVNNALSARTGRFHDEKVTTTRLLK